MSVENGHAQGRREGRRWQFGWCEFVEIRRQLLVHGEPVKIEAKPADVLVQLLEHPTTALTKDELIGAVWSNAPNGASDQSLTTAVRKLRQAFGGEREDLILSVSGIGYRMAVPVTEIMADEPAPAPFKLLPGDAIPLRPHWKAVRPLANGRPDTVWLGEHVKTREVRVFKFAVDGVRLRTLQREVTLSRLLQKSLTDTRGFVRVIDWELEESPFFIESEYGGLNLLEWSQTEHFQRLPLDGRVALAAELAESVAASHLLGILHNDLKPTNVLVADSSQDSATAVDLDANKTLPASAWRLKVADFGVASLTGPERLRQMEITQLGFPSDTAYAANGNTPVGSAMYCAPETLTGATPSVLTDVYALGVMLYQIACGDFLEPPSPGWERRIDDPILREDIAKAANIDPDARISSAAELVKRLRSLASRRAEKQELERALAASHHAQQALAEARLRRPWVILAMVALCLGLGASLWFAQRAAHARDLVEKRNATLTAMNGFLANDLLGQTNPLAGPAQSGQVERETLVEAIDRVLPSIDTRFRDAPEIAGQLHMAVAAALDARTEYMQAAKEFANASERFRQAEGPLSQNGIIAALRRDNAEMRTSIPSIIVQAKANLVTQQKLIAQVPDVSPELQTWYAMAQSGNLIYSSHPAGALPLLRTAIQRAKATAGFNPRLLSALEIRIGSVYLPMNDGAHAEQAERDAIAELESAGTQSLALAIPRLFLEEALVLEGKFKEAIAVGNSNYRQVRERLGPQNQLIMAILTNTAQAEGALEDYDDAIRDELALNEVAKTIPSARYLQEDTLTDVALAECRSGRFSSGMKHAQQVIKESSGGATALPVFVNVSRFTLAECLIAQQEGLGRAAPMHALDQAGVLLQELNIPLVQQTAGDAGFEGACDVEEARLALLRGQTALAKDEADKAAPFMLRSDADAYERRVLTRVRAALVSGKPASS